MLFRIGRALRIAPALLAAVILAASLPASSAGASRGPGTWLDLGPRPAAVDRAVDENRRKLPADYLRNLRYVRDDGTIRVMVALARRTAREERFVRRTTRDLHWYGDDPRFYASVDQQGFAALLRDPSVTFVEPDYPLTYLIAGSVSDVHARGPGGMWDFVVDGGLGALDSSYPGLGVEAATGKGVTVAVVDSGIDKTHRDFGGWDCEHGPYQPCDSRIVESVVIDQVAGTDTGAGEASPTTELASGHGTHVAGIIAGNGYYSRRGEANPEMFGGDGHAIGMAPQASLVSVKVGDGPSAALGSDALQWTLDHADELDIRVSNNSWGCLSGCAHRPESVLSQIQRDLYEAGVVTVFAAGNAGGEGEGTEFSGHSQSPYVLSVASYDDETDALSSFSARGERAAGLTHPAIWTPESEESPLRRPDIAAPGDSIWSAASLTGGTSSLVPRVDPEDAGQQPGIFGYTSMGGTSMATPHVTGAAALLVGACPRAEPLDVMRALMVGAQPDKISKTDASGVAQPYEVGYGALDVRASLDWLSARPACTGSGGGTIGGTVTSRSGGPVGGALVLCKDLDPVSSDALGQYRIDDVPPATYRCAAIADGFRKTSRTVSVQHGAVATTDFVLRKQKKRSSD